MRVMGLDFGSKTVGVAISDPLFVTAQGIEIIRRKEENKLRHTLQRIEELIGEYEVGQIVLGLPKNMNATEGERVEKTKEFADKLARRTGLPVALTCCIMRKAISWRLIRANASASSCSAIYRSASSLPSGKP